jgi:hypothetical protein
MKRYIATGASLAVALLIGGVVVAADLKSGPQVGATCIPFEPENVTGQFAGTKRCLV